MKELFDPSVPSAYELQVPLDPKEIFVPVAREGIPLEERGVDPQFHFSVIFGDAVLQEEEVNVSFEVDEEIEELPVGFQTVRQRAVLIVVEPADAFEREVPSVAYVRAPPPALVDAVDVLGEDEGSADGVCFTDDRFHPPAVVVHCGGDGFDEGAQEIFYFSNGPQQ